MGFFARDRERINDRTGLINHLIRTKGYRRYLEIGVRDPRHNFDRIRAEEKHGVDPNPRRPITHRMTSDAFFAARAAAAQSAPYDIVLIDGLHLAEQVERDVAHSLDALSPVGTLILHDCNPPTEDAQSETYDGKKVWNGTVWKAWVKLRATRSDLAMCVIEMDWGCGIIRRGSQVCYALPSLDYREINYALLERDRRRALNLITIDEFLGGAP